MKNIEISLTDNSDLIKDALEDQVEQALTAVGITAENNAKKEITRAVYDTPESKSYVRTGRLRNSLTHSVAMNEKAVYVGSAVGYAAYVELGTSRMRARPYLRQAVTNYTDEYKNLIKQALSR